MSHAKVLLQLVQSPAAESPVVAPYVPLGHGLSLPVAEPPGKSGFNEYLFVKIIPLK